MNLNVEYAHEEDEGEIIHGLLIAACVLNFVALAADILVVACRCTALPSYVTPLVYLFRLIKIGDLHHQAFHSYVLML